MRVTLARTALLFLLVFPAFAHAAVDLTASAVTPTSGTDASKITFSATFTDLDTNSTTLVFQVLFELSATNNPASFSSLAWASGFPLIPMVSLSSGQQSTTATTGSPAAFIMPPGTWYVRACANTDASGTTPAPYGPTETNYGNNCGTWTAVTITPANPSYPPYPLWAIPETLYGYAGGVGTAYAYTSQSSVAPGMSYQCATTNSSVQLMTTDTIYSQPPGYVRETLDSYGYPISPYNFYQYPSWFCFYPYGSQYSGDGWYYYGTTAPTPVENSGGSTCIGGGNLGPFSGGSCTTYYFPTQAIIYSAAQSCSTANSCGASAPGFCSSVGYYGTSNTSCPSPQLCSAAPPPTSSCAVNGACASTHYSCSSGTSANNVSGSTSWTWDCDGAYGGTNVSCSENKPINGSCGTANGKTYAYGTTGYGSDTQCSAGSSSDTSFPSAGSSVSWTCSGQYGGSASATCSASQAAPASCAATTVNNCDLLATASGNSSGSCAANYSGSCSYSCSNGTWSAVSNSCTYNLPDLTAGASAVSASPTTGAPVSFSASASNIGPGTATNFPNIFQIADSGITTTIAMVSANNISSLAPNASAGISATYTFSSPATYNVRACADTTTTWGHPATESNTNNDCGAWQPFTVNYPALSASCEPSSSTAYVGDTVTWTAAPAGGSGSYAYSWSGTDSLSGSTKSVSTAYSTTGTKSASVTVTGGGSTTANCSPSVTVKANPTALLSPPSATIIKGQGSVQLTWTSSDATSCSGTNFSTGGATSGFATVAPSTTTTYTLTCTDGTKNGYSAATVTVIDLVLTVSASPNPVRSGDTTTVSWSTSGTPDSCTMQGPGLSSTAPSGSATPTITEQSTYTLTCVKNGASTAKSTTVNLTPRYQEI